LLARTGLLLLVFALCAIAGISTFYFVKEHRQVRDLSARNQALSANLSQVQSQLQSLSEKLNALPAPLPAPAPVNAPASSRPSALSANKHARAASHRVAAHRKPADDPRWNQVQSQLSEQQKQLASTREEVDKTRTELDGKLNSTRDELNGSIAITHEQLVALEKRGERSYYEFHLDKSKTFQRVGPISLSLRKVDVKHKHYNLAMMVDDSQLDKKNVNLFEPVWITLSDRPQPVELVVNQIHRDQIQGYLSEPKYKKSELAASAAASR
jgi:cell division protein FtsB